MGKRINDDMIDKVVRESLVCKTNAEIAKNLNISINTITKIRKTPEFVERIEKAHQVALDEVTEYISANLRECAEALMEIVRDEEVKPQIRINAVNAMFSSYRHTSGVSTDNGIAYILQNMNTMSDVISNPVPNRRIEDYE